MRNGVVAVAATECRRTVRAIAGNRTKLLAMVVIATFALGPATTIAVLLLPTVGETVAAGGIDPETAALALEAATGGAALAWLFLAVMAAVRTVTTAADVDRPACLLVATRVRTVVAGIVGSEILLFAAWTVPPATVAAAAFASGAGTPVPLLVAPLFVAVLLVTAVPAGFLVGIWFRHLITVYEPIARYRTPLLAALALAYFGSIAVGWFDVVTSGLFALLGDGPLGWPGHLLLVGVPNVASSSQVALAALVAAPIVGLVAVAAAVPSARIHWFADPARTGEATVSETERSTGRIETGLSRAFSRPVRTVTITAIRRTRRAPIRLAYVAYPLFGALFFVQDVLQAGRLPTYVAVLLCLYVVWGTGVLFTLNPLGDLGRALPAVMTSTIDGRQLIRGRMLASTLVGAPVGAAVAVVVGLASPLSLESTAALLAGTVVGTVVSPALAVGAGAAFPRFGTVSITTNREAVMPSKSAFLVYTAGVVLPSAAAAILYADLAEPVAMTASAVLAVAPLSIPVTAVSPETITTGAWTILLVGVVAPPVAYLYAVERFDWYVLE